MGGAEASKMGTCGERNGEKRQLGRRQRGGNGQKWPEERRKQKMKRKMSGKIKEK